MLRETFQQELDGLISDVAAFGAEVEGSLKNTVVAMEARDADVARQELGVDARYKARGMDIERVHDPAGPPGPRGPRPQAPLHRAVRDEPPRAVRNTLRAHLPRNRGHGRVRARRG